MKGKKGLVWSEIGKWILMGLLLLTLLIIIGIMTGGMQKLWSGLQDIFSFGG